MKAIEKMEFRDNLKTMKHFISAEQVQTLKDIFKGEESKYALDIVKTLAGIIESVPKSYETEKTDTPDKILYLHYFYGSSNWYIIEKDRGNPEDDAEAGLTVGGQYQAFGYVILGGDTINAEWGYIDIEELITNNVQLDFHWEPIKFSELKKK